MIERLNKIVYSDKILIQQKGNVDGICCADDGDRKRDCDGDGEVMMAITLV